MKLTKTFIILLCFSIFIGLSPAYALDDETGFELLDTKDISDLNGKAYYYKHTETGAEVVFLENDSENWNFLLALRRRRLIIKRKSCFGTQFALRQ